MENITFYHNGGSIQNEEEPSGWYFWTETWVDYIGPYNTYEECNRYLHLYAEQL